MNDLHRAMHHHCVECDDVFQCTDDVADEDRCDLRGHHSLITEADLHKVVCPRCKGEGRLRGYPGVYTQADFAEDPDFFEDYMAFERTCEDCNGLRVIEELTPEAEARPEVYAYLKEAWEADAVEAQERRMGA